MNKNILSRPIALFTRYPKTMIVLFVLVLIRAFLPEIGLRIINWSLENKLGAYHGHIGDFDLELYRGSYQLQDLTIKKRNSDLPPLIVANQVDLQIAWKPLLKGEIAAHVILDKGQVHLTDNKAPEKKQITMVEEKPLAQGEKPTWQKTLDVVIPMKIESLIVHDSAVYFTNTNFGEPIPVQIEKVEFTAENLRTRPSDQISTLSPVYGEGLFQKHALVKLVGRIDALADEARGDVDFQLTDFDFKKINSVMMAYIPVDITRGVLNVYGEMTMSKGQAKGYVNLFLKDGDVIAPRQKFVSIKHFVYEIGSALGYWILKNSSSKKLATHIEFNKKDDKWDIDGSTAFWSALKNKFDEMKPGLEHSVSLRNIEGSESANPVQ